MPRLSEFDFNGLYRYLAEVINKTWNFSGRCESHKDEVMNAITGLSGESGEVADVIKKAYFHSPPPMDVTIYKLTLELGDVMFYWLKLADLFKIPIEEIIEQNRLKLESRHPELGKVTERFGKDMVK